MKNKSKIKFKAERVAKLMNVEINQLNLPGYHLDHIEKGEVGEASKIKEETEEFLEALKQGVKLMAIHELSDLYGAIEAYLEKHCPNIKMNDLKVMSDVTKRAFRNGYR